jgi:hypothetical protein
MAILHRTENGCWPHPLNREPSIQRAITEPADHVVHGKALGRCTCRYSECVGGHLGEAAVTNCGLIAEDGIGRQGAKSLRRRSIRRTAVGVDAMSLDAESNAVDG